IACRHPVDDFRNVLRRHGADRKTIRPGVVFPFAANDDLEMRNLAIADRPARAIEAKVRDVVLAARVEASANLDVQVFDRLIKSEELVGKTCANLTSKTSRRSDAE